MVDIFDEVSEDLRADRAQALLKRYGILLVLAAVLVVAAAGAWQAWRWRGKQHADQVATEFLGAMREGGTAPGTEAAATLARTEALTQYDALAASAPEGYRVLSRLRAAALRAGTGDLQGALSEWDQVSSDVSADPLLRGLADLLWVQHQVDAGDPAAVEGRLLPLLAPGSPWRPAAMENQAWLALRTGNDGKAKDILRQLRTDPGASDGVRARANAMLIQLGDAPG